MTKRANHQENNSLVIDNYVNYITGKTHYPFSALPPLPETNTHTNTKKSRTNHELQ